MGPILLNPSCHTGTALCPNPGSFLVLTLALVWCVTCLNCRNHTSKFLSPPFFLERVLRGCLSWIKCCLDSCCNQKCCQSLALTVDFLSKSFL